MSSRELKDLVIAHLDGDDKLGAIVQVPCMIRSIATSHGQGRTVATVELWPAWTDAVAKTVTVHIDCADLCDPITTGQDAAKE